MAQLQEGDDKVLRCPLRRRQWRLPCFAQASLPPWWQYGLPNTGEGSRQAMHARDRLRQMVPGGRRS